MNAPVTATTVLQDFRADLYHCLERRADALFELADAILTAGPQPALAHLSLAPAHRRGWGSLYAALRHGRLDVAALRALLERHPLDEGPPVYAVDSSVWPRCDAETSAERGYSYHPSRHLDGEPIVRGWADHWLVQPGFTRDSWTAPIDVERVRPQESVTDVAVAQLRAFLRRRPAGATAPLVVFDSGYDVTALTHALADEPVALLVRLRSDRCFYFPPPIIRSEPRGGRPRRNGAQFRCDDPATWPAPTAEHTCEDAQYGTVTVQAWGALHTVVRSAPGTGTYAPRPHVTGTVLRVTVTRHAGRAHGPLALWLWWQGPDTPDLDLLWRAYLRRYAIEHTFRFLKQVLNWATPQVRTPEQADRWTWVVLAAYTQLRLARGLVCEQRLPWARPLAPAKLTPYRVRRAISALLATVGTPASPPKPCGRSPGRPQGRRSGPAPRCPAIKKAA